MQGTVAFLEILVLAELFELSFGNNNLSRIPIPIFYGTSTIARATWAGWLLYNLLAVTLIMSHVCGFTFANSASFRHEKPAKTAPASCMQYQEEISSKLKLPESVARLGLKSPLLLTVVSNCSTTVD